MSNKLVWIWMLGGIGLLFLPHSTTADDASLHLADLERSLASIEREEAVVAKTDNADAKTLLAEVHRNIALTLADGREDQPAGREFVRRVPQRQNVRLQAKPAPKSGKRKAESEVEIDRGPRMPAFQQRHGPTWQSVEPVREPRQVASEHAQQRIGAAIGELRKDVDRLRKEMDAIRQLFRKYHDTHGKAEPAAVDLDATLKKLLAVQESLDQFYRSETVQLHAEAVRRDLEVKRRAMGNHHHEMRERVEEQQAVSRNRKEAAQREAEVLRRVMETNRRMLEQQVKAANEMAAKERAAHDKSVKAKAAAKRKMEEIKKRREVDSRKRRAAEKKTKRDKKEHDDKSSR